MMTSELSPSSMPRWVVELSSMTNIPPPSVPSMISPFSAEAAVSISVLLMPSLSSYTLVILSSFIIAAPPVYIAMNDPSALSITVLTRLDGRPSFSVNLISLPLSYRRSPCSPKVENQSLFLLSRIIERILQPCSSLIRSLSLNISPEALLDDVMGSVSTFFRL